LICADIDDHISSRRELDGEAIQASRSGSSTIFARSGVPRTVAGVGKDLKVLEPTEPAA